MKGLRRTFGAERDRDSPHEAEHARSSPGQFQGESVTVGSVIPVQQPKSRTRKLICLILFSTSDLPGVIQQFFATAKTTDLRLISVIFSYLFACHPFPCPPVGVKGLHINST